MEDTQFCVCSTFCRQCHCPLAQTVTDGESLQLSLLFLAVCRQISMRKGQITQRCETHSEREHARQPGHRERRGEWHGGETVGQLQSCVHNSANAPQGAVTLQMGQIISMFPLLHALTYTHTHTPYIHTLLHTATYTNTP